MRIKYGLNAKPLMGCFGPAGEKSDAVCSACHYSGKSSGDEKAWKTECLCVTCDLS